MNVTLSVLTVRSENMEWKMVDLEERTDYDRKTGFYRYKEAIFTVNGSQHTLRISMKDFNADLTTAIVQKEVDKIIAALGKKK